MKRVFVRLLIVFLFVAHCPQSKVRGASVCLAQLSAVQTPGTQPDRKETKSQVQPGNERKRNESEDVARQKAREQAAKELKEGNYRAAYRRFRKLAARGCPYSQCLVAIMHQKGIAVKRNHKKALSWFEKSAKQGLPDAEHRLGRAYLRTGGMQKDFEKGMHWLSAAEAHGVKEAKAELAEAERELGAAFKSGRKFLGKEASEVLSVGASAASGFPALKGAGSEPENAYARGLENVQKSWLGYFDLAKNLDSLNNAGSKKL